MKPAVLALLFPLMSNAANYSAKTAVVDGVEIVQLADAARHTQVSIAPSVGNIAYEMKVNGKNALWTPFASVGEMKAKPAHCGVPFLWPWANRIDQDAYWVNGKKYLLNPELHNFRYDQNHKPIHGLVIFSPYWKVTSVAADDSSAHVTSRLDFWRYPDLMAQFPFAHVVDMTYRLREGVLEVETVLENLSTAPMPVSLGYHPYFQLHDAPREEWRVHLPAREQVVLSDLLIPTGERKPMRYADPQPLAGISLDDVFSGLIFSEGKARFTVEGKREKISVLYGPKYPIAIAYSPRGRPFICFEPMAAVTNAFNLAHQGLYHELQSVPPGGRWRESFWIAPSGF